MEKLKLKDTFLNGIIRSNPVFVLVLGMCPVIAMSANVTQAFAMGAATMIVLVFSNILISLMRGIIPARIRMPSYIIIVSTFVICLQLVMRKFLPGLYSQMQAFIALIVVNCIILARAESFASCNKVKDSALDGLAAGLGFLLAITLLGTVRELVSSGSFAGYEIFSAVRAKSHNFPYYAGVVISSAGAVTIGAAAVLSVFDPAKINLSKLLPTLLIAGGCAAFLGLLLSGAYPKMYSSAAKPLGFLVLAVIMATINNIRLKKEKTGGSKK